jgi:hypothetical protein
MGIGHMMLYLVVVAHIQVSMDIVHRRQDLGY